MSLLVRVVAPHFVAGIVFDKAPFEILQVRRPFYDAGASLGGGAKEYYEKGFWRNTTGQVLTGGSVREVSDPPGRITFGLASTINDTGTNGPGNSRQVAPGGITFDNADKSVVQGGLLGNSGQGVWLKLLLPDGEPALNTVYQMRLIGT